MRHLLLCGCLLLTLTGCGYQLERQSRLPEGGEAVFVEVPVNRTSKPFIESMLARELSRRVSDLAGVRLVTDRASSDVVVEGVIRNYRRKPSVYRGRDEVAEYQLTVVATLGLRQQKDGTLLWQQELAWSSEFLADPDLEIQENRELQVALEICQQLARQFAARVQERF